ncbi:MULTISPECIES: glycosyltransferase family 39 protein [unclassified Synechococcus]|uniref:ArnT family glycosyltransferase n=1 Tax=unclassified Synechococcus TaxID=2626047 RepID=UPI0020CBEC13|nr:MULTISPECIES: phospholipid carrier-dependent glycosyltransferase [unclassified Synechococcus]
MYEGRASRFRPVGLLVWCAVLASSLFALWFWLSTASQPLVDQYEFRQTQTALTAFHLFRNGNGLLNYETPVLGKPWSIPFEFPTFQLAAYSLQKISALDLTSAGRLTSIGFALACLAISIAILRQFSISRIGIVVFALLYLSSPIYLYWSRTFMIESTALLFSLAALYLYWASRRQDDWRGRKSLSILTALLICLTMALLTKATTALPVFLLILIDQAYVMGAATLRRTHSVDRHRILPRGGMVLTILLLSFLVLKGWTTHADALKDLNPIARFLTSQRLASWNFGDFHQRHSGDLWIGVFSQRMLTPNGSIPIAILLTLGIIRPHPSSQSRYLLLCCMGLALAPLLIFTNLHIVHTYYQYANEIYLLLAIAVASDALSGSGRRSWNLLLGICLTLIIISFYGTFFGSYYRDAQLKDNAASVAGRYIRNITNPAEAILVFGDDWNSAMAFHSQRRALTYPNWAASDDGIKKDDLLANPADFIGPLKLGAIASRWKKIPAEKVLMACGGAASPNPHAEGDWLIYSCRSGTAAGALQDVSSEAKP